MTVVVVLVLVVAWAIVLLPPVLRARTQHRPADSITEFHRRLNVLRRTGGYAPVPSPVEPATAPILPVAAAGPRVAARVRRRSAVRRRHDVFVTLLAGVVVTGLLAAVPVLHELWILNVVFDVALAVYVALLLRLRSAMAEREMKVRYLRTQPATAPLPDLALRRSVSS